MPCSESGHLSLAATVKLRIMYSKRKHLNAIKILLISWLAHIPILQPEYNPVTVIYSDARGTDFRCILTSLARSPTSRR
jgi:hypothetical protein